MILKLLLIIFLVTIVFIGSVVIKLLNLINQGSRMFRGQVNGRNHQKQQQQRRKSSNPTIVDCRNDQQINQKIFDKDEGEYVDFEEEK